MRDMGQFFRWSSGAILMALAMPALAAAPQPVQLQPAQQPLAAAPTQPQASPAETNARLTSAVGTGTPQEVEQLLKSGGNPNGSDSRGMPLLSLAALRSDANAPGIMRALIATGADINIRDQYQQTPLIYAVRGAQLANVQVLVSGGADIEASDRSGNTALTYAKFAHRDDIVGALHPASHPAATTAKPTAPGVDRAQLLQSIRNLAFHSCATEYWRFCHRVNQSTDLPGGNSRAEADTQENQAGNDADTLRHSFGAKDNYVLGITDYSRSDILRQLGESPTNAQRKEEGIGTRADMEKRCGDIADAWDFSRLEKNTAGGVPTPGAENYNNSAAPGESGPPNPMAQGAPGTTPTSPTGIGTAPATKPQAQPAPPQNNQNNNGGLTSGMKRIF